LRKKFFLQSSEFASKIARLSSIFGEVHHIKLEEGELREEAELGGGVTAGLDWVTETLARLFIHSRLYQCTR